VNDPYELTETAVATLSVPYAADANRLALGSPLPDLFIVYKRISAVAQNHFDDAEKERFCRMQLSVYSRSGLVGLPATDTAMQAQGFQFSRETEIPYDDGTGHYGLAREYTILLNV
jgi:hypothetical protein